MEDNNRVSIKLVLHGKVQGVGVRFVVNKIAKDFDVEGYAKNLSDGTVEIVAVGDKLEIQRFVETIKKDVPGTIEKIVLTKTSVLQHFSGFTIEL
jgi:acylphosphatase